jgi:hypothetical protein
LLRPRPQRLRPRRSRETWASSCRTRLAPARGASPRSALALSPSDHQHAAGVLRDIGRGNARWNHRMPSLPPGPRCGLECAHQRLGGRGYIWICRQPRHDRPSAPQGAQRLPSSTSPARSTHRVRVFPCSDGDRRPACTFSVVMAMGIDSTRLRSSPADDGAHALAFHVVVP